ncbi:MFS glucose transporter mfs1 [Fulvia fulva]|uniref:MFS glucose transporter mfs1 n=1 Tax=Passalora fulva TaxID=5499 RepID=A0A9Q8LF53_PASFU|nr:MFS glucose transporter mfs1 [Fulvia fulva]KAK4626224.1 MFS glucose transporter mfs1 [Fulvia fulva]KAK4628677.1 MFS glucose transporter mfs1 [Fulvia fulva]UJO16074.1 MFS glucose transporter mfs1 [Fulvia fulva]WPV14131.1 MFS glucose transporter mfs1 [Fulvia fulva]WPV29234.1 MFS glucose transporter mfs1 [Fulvia fulva]
MDATKARTDDASLAKTLPSEYVFTSDTDRDNTASAAAIARVEAAQKTKWTRLFHNPKLIFIAFFASFGGFEYGYQQGVLGQSFVMTRFIDNFPDIAGSSSAQGWLTSVLQLGGILGSLSAGILGEVFSRKYTMFSACIWVILGSYLYCGASYHNSSLLYAGRFFTGLGAGTFSGVGPLYNAELSTPELRGLLVSFYQFATILGIMLSFWVGYGSNYIGGIGDGQSDLAWRLPSIIQGIPAVCLALGIWWMPFSPRWLVKKDRDDEAIKTLSWLRKLPKEDPLIQVEYLEIKSEAIFEQRAFDRDFPHLSEPQKRSVLRREAAQYVAIVRSWDNFKRVSTAWLVMFFQQWSGIDAIIYYASSVFQSFGLTGGTQALLATGVTGVVFFVSTIPAMLVIDKVGRKSMLLAGSVVMLIAMVITGIIVAKLQHDWPSHRAGGWTAVSFIWVYIGAFGATWGPASWTLVSEIFPLSIRSKGASIGASSNWLNNFAIAFFVPPMFEAWEWGTYIFFAVFLTAGIVWVWFFLPETKGATLEDMDRVFGSHTGEADQRLLSECRRELGLEPALEAEAIEEVRRLSVAVEKDAAARVEVV